MTEIKLFSARACPFAHRTRLVLTEKNLPFELIEIDLQHKPAWFDAKISGYGKVPALEHDGQHIWESAVINEYLDEAFPSPRLLPSEPAARAQARIWIDFANSRFAPAFGRLLRAAEGGSEIEARRELTDGLARLERAIERASSEGPYFLGATPSLVDFAIYPWFERWPALERFRDFAIPAELSRLQHWLEHVRALPSVRKQENPAAYYIQRYADTLTPAAKRWREDSATLAF
ncbi:MAG TPA: glutathione S-transferase family protein [Polyangiales bacterium]|jgi:glutathione S-transferase